MTSPQDMSASQGLGQPGSGSRDDQAAPATAALACCCVYCVELGAPELCRDYGSAPSSSPSPQDRIDVEGLKAEPNGANPYYTPTIMAAFRAYKEAEYGGKLPDDLFRLGHGDHDAEPYFTKMAIEFRLFKAGAEWVDAFRLADGQTKPNAELIAQRAALVETAKELADDLQGELDARYAETKDHPAMRRRFDRDMDSVVRARTLLAAIAKALGQDGESAS